jgi:hypothetical protein
MFYLIVPKTYVRANEHLNNYYIIWIDNIYNFVLFRSHHWFAFIVLPDTEKRRHKGINSMSSICPSQNLPYISLAIFTEKHLLPVLSKSWKKQIHLNGGTHGQNIFFRSYPQTSQSCISIYLTIIYHWNILLTAQVFGCFYSILRWYTCTKHFLL